MQPVAQKCRGVSSIYATGCIVSMPCLDSGPCRLPTPCSPPLFERRRPATTWLAGSNRRLLLARDSATNRSTANWRAWKGRLERQHPGRPWQDLQEELPRAGGRARRTGIAGPGTGPADGPARRVHREAARIAGARRNRSRTGAATPHRLARRTAGAVPRHRGADFAWQAPGERAQRIQSHDPQERRIPVEQVKSTAGRDMLGGVAGATDLGGPSTNP